MTFGLLTAKLEKIKGVAEYFVYFVFIKYLSSSYTYSQKFGDFLHAQFMLASILGQHLTKLFSLEC